MLSNFPRLISHKKQEPYSPNDLKFVRLMKREIPEEATVVPKDPEVKSDTHASVKESLGFVVSHNFICSQMKTAFKHASTISRENWRQQTATSGPTSTSVSQIRPCERDVIVKHHDKKPRKSHVTKWEDTQSRIKSDVTTSASSAFRWRIENWRRRTNLSSTDQSRRTMSTSIGTDSRRLGSGSAQPRDRMDTLSIPIEESDLDLELTRSLTKSTSRSGHAGNHIGSIVETERSFRKGNIVLEHLRLEPIRQVSLVGNDSLIKEQGGGFFNSRQSSRKLSSTDRSLIRPLPYDHDGGTVDGWSQTGRKRAKNTKLVYPPVGSVSQRNPEYSDNLHDSRTPHCVRYYKKRTSRSSHTPSTHSQREDTGRVAQKHNMARRHRTTLDGEYQHSHSTQRESREQSWNNPQYQRRIEHQDSNEDDRELYNISSIAISGKLNPLYPTGVHEYSEVFHRPDGRIYKHSAGNTQGGDDIGHTSPYEAFFSRDSRKALQESSKTSDKRKEMDKKRKTEIGSAGPQDESMVLSYEPHGSHMSHGLPVPGEEHAPRSEMSSNERKARKRSRRKKKKKSQLSQGQL
nr:uncharacterized protein LOC129267068 [Lytechinus pictus]